MDALYSQLVPDWALMSQLMSLGFSETEARLGLRACQGDIQRAAELISTQREVTPTHASILVYLDDQDTHNESLIHSLTSYLSLLLQEREELRRRERSRRSSNRRRRRREEALSSSLQQLGFSPSEASQAAQLAQGDLDRACGVSGYLHCDAVIDPNLTNANASSLSFDLRSSWTLMATISSWRPSIWRSCSR